MRSFRSIAIASALLSPLSAEVYLSSDKDSYIVGEHVEVNFSGLESYGADWIGIFDIASPNDEYIYWQYTDGTQENNYTFVDSGYLNFSPISLPVGEYEIRLFYSNGYEVVRSTPFNVTDSCFEPPSSGFGDTFNVMTFNTWHSAQYGYGGLERVAEIISDLDIDIIGFQETDNASIYDIQTLLEGYAGYEYMYVAPSSWNIGILSRLPILGIYDYNLYGIGASVLLPEADTLKFVSSHLTAYPYGPYSLYEGYTIDDVIGDELSTRYIENLDIYNQILADPGTIPSAPVIYVGDHNTPSHLDWGTDNLNQNFGFEVAWPVSEFLLENDFHDSYREVHPDPYTSPGLTWSPGYPKDSFDSWDVHDRIDMVYYSDGQDRRLHPIESYAYDCDPWPSDHRAVITEFALCIDSINGDINYDGGTDILDIVLLVEQVVSGAGSYCLFTLSDMNNDKELNILDIVQLMNQILSS